MSEKKEKPLVTKEDKRPDRKCSVCPATCKNPCSNKTIAKSTGCKNFQG